jgi:hypothetical protein
MESESSYELELRLQELGMQQADECEDEVARREFKQRYKDVIEEMKRETNG